MPGFGSGPFGNFPFGEWGWTDAMLFQNIPEVYRQADEGEVGDGALQAFVDSIRPSFDVLRRYMRSFGDLRDPFRVLTQYDGAATFRLGKKIEPLEEIEQNGVDGLITVARAFVSPTARFRQEDRGKKLTVRGSAIPGNNRVFLIGAVVDTTTVILDPLATADAGPLRWDVRAPINQDPDTTIVEVQEGDVGLVSLGWAISDGNADYNIRGRRRLPSPTSDRTPLTELEGLDGTIDTQGRFVSPTALFSKRHVGQILSLDGSPELDNKTYVRIRRIDGAVAPQVVWLSDISTGVAVTLSPETGPFHWALYPRSRLSLQTSGPPVGTVEQEGFDLEVIASGADTILFTAPSATFDVDRDVGKVLRLVSFTNPVNNRLLVITSFNDPVTGIATILSPPYPATGSIIVETNMFWELRAQTGLGDLVQLEAHPVSILQYLATDFGIQIDSQESEDIQRSWVKNVTSWLDLKGTEKGYEIIGLISGFTITAEALYRITQDLLPTIPDLYEVELREYVSEIRSGGNGSLVLVGSSYRFSSPTGNFTEDDVGRAIVVSGATIGSNNTTYSVSAFLDGQTVEITPFPTVPEPGNGGLQWSYRRSRYGSATEVPFNNDGAFTFTPMFGYYFSSPTGIFYPHDVGRQLLIVGAAVSGNNKYYTIEEYVSPTVVRVRYVDAPTLPEANSGLLEWYVIRLYTTLPPLLPRYDEINTDALAYWIATNPPASDFFAADTFCWEDNFSTSVDITITFVTNTIPNREWSVTFTGPGEVVSDIGRWRFTDLASNQFYLESVPVEVPPLSGNWVTTIKSLNGPALGAGTLSYRCQAQLICEYCAASKILATIVAGSALSLSATALERYRERILNRLKDVTPAHVELIPRFQTIIEAVFSISATIEPGLVSASIVAPFTALYDEIPADYYGAPAPDGITLFYTDMAILATITTP